ncbi:MAG: hypothetical protein AB7O73_03640 [Bacteroidia bacterium]
MKSTRTIFTLLAIFILSNFSFSQPEEKDPLEKRKFTISLNMEKDGVPQKKVIADELEFKKGKVFSDYVYDKFSFKWIKYRINKDSIYTDSTDTEVRLLEVEAIATDASNQTCNISFKLVEWEIEGTIKITKNDKIKKFYNFVGREKGGKPKKKKKSEMKKTDIPRMKEDVENENKDY